MKTQVLKRILFALLFMMIALPMVNTRAEAKVILTGNKKVDMAAEAIIQRCTKPNMTKKQKLKKCYAYIVNKMIYTHSDGRVRVKLSKKEKKAVSAALKSLKLSGNVKYSKKFRGGFRNILTLRGTCYDMSAVMCILANHLGYNAGYVKGRYVRGNGSTVHHWWNYIVVNGKKLYCDVQAANDISKKHKYNWYLKSGSNRSWRKHHRW